MVDLFGEPLGNLLTIALLLAAGAFFVAAEFALVKARGLKPDPSSERGGGVAFLAQKIRRDLEAHLASCQLGITMASLGLGWVAEPVVAALLEPSFVALGLSERALHTVSFLAGFLLFCSLHVVLAQQLPKTLAIRRSAAVSLAVVLPLHTFHLLFYPLTWLLSSASKGITSLLGIEESADVGVPTAAVVRGPIDFSKERGDHQRERLTTLHYFIPFDDRPVKRAMVPRREVVHLTIGATPDESLRLITETSHSWLPLVEGDWENLIGVVPVKTVLGSILKGDDALGRIQSFARQPLMVPESERVARLFEAMRAKRAHMAFVLDEYGEFVGLVTLEDLLDELGADIAAELYDEEGIFGIRFVDPGWEADGLASLADVRRLTGFSPEPVDANTLSGFFMQRLERMPVIGDRWEENGYRLTVTAVRQRHVQICELLRLAE